MENKKVIADLAKGSEADSASRRIENFEEDAKDVFKALRAQNFQLTVSQIQM